MGLFSTKKKTVVSSAVYNLAGDKIEDFLRQAILESVFLEETQNFSTHLPKAILNSEGFKIRRYINWCKNQPKGREYCDLIGHMYISYGSTLENSVIENIFKTALNLPESQNVNIDSIQIELADYYYWGAKYLAENYSQYTDETLYDFTCDLNNQTIIIHVFDLNQNEIDTISFIASDYDPDEYYLYVAYQIYNLNPVYQDDGEGNLVLDEQNNPILIGYEEPDPETITEDLSYFIYARNTSVTDPNYNAALTELFSTLDSHTNHTTFILPPVPFRLDNWQVSSAQEENTNDWKLYQLSKTACFKIFQDRSVYKKLDKTILKNPSIDDLDYIYLVFGVSLNTKNWAGKQYLYETIASLYTQYVSTGAKYIDIKAQGYRSNFEYRISWDDIEFGTMSADEVFYTVDDNIQIPFSSAHAEPITIFTNSKDKYAVFHTVDTSEVTYGSEHTHIRFGNGWTYFVYRKTVYATTYSYYRVHNLVHYNRVHKGKEVRTRARDVWFQPTENVTSYPELLTDYEESPFIFPLQEDLYRKLPVLTQAQLSMSFAYLQFNCYEIQKIKWYQSAWFTTVIAVVILVIQAVTFYFSVGTTAAAGNAAGSAASSAGSAAGATVSQSAAQAITQLVKMAATALIGTLVAKASVAILRALGVNNIIANIIGTIAGICAASAFGSWMNSATETSTLANEETFADTMMQKLAEDYAIEVTAVANTTSVPTIITLFKEGMFNFLTSPMKILNFSLSVTESAVKGYYQDKFDELNKLAKQVSYLQEETEKQEKFLATLSASSYSEWQKQMMLHKIQTSIKPEVYFTFSLMTGSEIADLTINALDNYLDMSATLEYV